MLAVSLVAVGVGATAYIAHRQGALPEKLDRIVACVLQKTGLEPADETPVPKEAPSHASLRALELLMAQKKSPFVKGNKEHEALLMSLWHNLMPNKKLSARVSDDWGNIGFQGTEPSTDFRGMGLLGLEALSYVAKHHNDLAQRILRPRDDTYFYFYAIGGINIAATALSFLHKEANVANRLFADTENTSQDQLLAIFGEFFAHEWLQFDEFFIQGINAFINDGGERELCIMQFESVRHGFEHDMKRRFVKLGKVVVRALRDKKDPLVWFSNLLSDQADRVLGSLREQAHDVQKEE